MIEKKKIKSNKSLFIFYIWNKHFTCVPPYSFYKHSCCLQPRGTPQKLGRGVRPASQNPYPIYDQNLRFSLPYLWPDQKFDTLFMTWPLNQYPVSDLPYIYFPSSDQC